MTSTRSPGRASAAMAAGRAARSARKRASRPGGGDPGHQVGGRDVAGDGAAGVEDLRQPEHVVGAQGRGEGRDQGVLQEARGAEAVGLEHRQQAAAALQAGPGRGQGGGDLVGVVGEVVDHLDAAGRAQADEAPGHAAEAGQGGGADRVRRRPGPGPRPRRRRRSAPCAARAGARGRRCRPGGSAPGRGAGPGPAAKTPSGARAGARPGRSARRPRPARPGSRSAPSTKGPPVCCRKVRNMASTSAGLLWSRPRFSTTPHQGW